MIFLFLFHFLPTLAHINLSNFKKENNPNEFRERTIKFEGLKSKNSSAFLNW